jgi:hypothetical protein
MTGGPNANNVHALDAEQRPRAWPATAAEDQEVAT